MNPYGTIVGPEGTETIVSTHEAVKAGYQVTWKSKEELIMTKDGVKLPVEVHNGTAVLPHETTNGAEMKSLTAEKEEDDFELQNVWPLLPNVLKWLIRNQLDKAVKLMKLMLKKN